VTFTGTHFFKHELTTDQPTLPGTSPFVITGLAGDEIPNVPTTQLYFSFVFEHPVGDGMMFSMITDVSYRSSTNTEFRPDSPFNIPLDSFAETSVFANLDVNEKLTVGAYVRNIGNELGVVDGISTFQDPEAVVGLRPRTFGLRLVYSY